jgi:hypothetical protein
MVSRLKTEYYCGVTVDPEDVFHTGPHDANTENARARQERLENIASRFLDNQTPHIMSALLKGPFGKESGWSNPYLGAASQPTRQPTPIIQRRGSNITASEKLLRDMGQSTRQVRHPEKTRNSKLRVEPQPVMETTDRIERWKKDVPPLKKDGFYRQYLREIKSAAGEGCEITSKRRKTTSIDATPASNGFSTPAPRQCRTESFQTPTKRSSCEGAKDELAANPSSSFSPASSNIAQHGSSPTARVSPKRTVYDSKLAADSEDELARAEAANRKAAATLSSPVSDVGQPSQSAKGSTALPPPKFNITSSQTRPKSPTIFRASSATEEHKQDKKRKLSDLELTDYTQHGTTQPMTPESGIAERPSHMPSDSSDTSSSLSSCDSDDDTSSTDERITQSLVKIVTNQPDDLERTDSESDCLTELGARNDDSQSGEGSASEDDDGRESEEEDTFSTMTDTRMRELSVEVRDFQGDVNSSSIVARSESIGLEDSIVVSVDEASSSEGSISSDNMEVDVELQRDNEKAAIESEDRSPAKPAEDLFKPNGMQSIGPGDVPVKEQQSPWSKSQDTQSLGRALQELAPNVKQAEAFPTEEPCTPSEQSPWSKSQDAHILQVARPVSPDHHENLQPTEAANVPRTPSPKSNETMRPSTPTVNRPGSDSAFTIRPFSAFYTPSPKRSTRHEHMEASSWQRSTGKPSLVSAMKKLNSAKTSRSDKHVSWADEITATSKGLASAQIDATPTVIKEASRAREMSPPPPRHLSEQGLGDKEFTSHFRAMVSRASDAPHRVHNLTFDSPTLPRTETCLLGSQEDKEPAITCFDTEMPLAGLDASFDTDLLTDMVFQNIENECFGGLDIDAELTNM